jgi:hypothetical protein
MIKLPLVTPSLYHMWASLCFSFESASSKFKRSIKTGPKALELEHHKQPTYAIKTALDRKTNNHKNIHLAKLTQQGILFHQIHPRLAPSPNHLFMSTEKLNLGGWRHMPPSSSLNRDLIEKFDSPIMFYLDCLALFHLLLIFYLI